MAAEISAMSSASAGTVLIVGSNPSGLIVARNVLARAGYGVITCSTWIEGYKLFGRVQPIALILDDAHSYGTALRELLRRVPERVRIILSVPKGRAPELLSS